MLKKAWILSILLYSQLAFAKSEAPCDPGAKSIATTDDALQVFVNTIYNLKNLVTPTFTRLQIGLRDVALPNLKPGDSLPADISDLAKSLSPFFGKCLLPQEEKIKRTNGRSPANLVSPETYTKVSPPKLDRNINAFDQTIVELWKNQMIQSNNPKLAALLTKENMIAIDGLARTIYGEMAICYYTLGKENPLNCGREYLIGVAANILKRAQYHIANKDNSMPGQAWTRERFAPLEDLPLKNVLSSVLSKKAQYSVWNHGTHANPNTGLQHVLCPPQKAGQFFYTNWRASKQDSIVWEESLLIAMEAVLQPEKFSEIIKNVPYYYTSRIGDYMKEQFKMVKAEAPIVNKKKLDNKRCFDWWKYPGE